MNGFNVLELLADSPDHIISGHDHVTGSTISSQTSRTSSHASSYGTGYGTGVTVSAYELPPYRLVAGGEYGPHGGPHLINTYVARH